MTVPGAQTMHIPAGVAFDESRREELIQPGEANLSQTNVRFDELGALRHRAGHEQITSTRAAGASGPTEPQALFAHDNQLLRISRDTVDVLDEGMNAWFPVGAVADATCRRITVASPDILGGGTEAYASIGYTGSLYVVACKVRGNDLAVYFVSRETGATVFQASVSANVETVKVLVSGNYVWVLYDDGGTDDIKAVRFDATSSTTLATAPTTTTLITDFLAAGEPWDAFASASRFYVAYTNDTAATARVTVTSFTPATAAVVATATLTTQNDFIRAVGIHGSDSDFVWVSHATAFTFSVMVEGRNPSTLALTSSQITAMNTGGGISRISVARSSSTDVYVGCHFYDATVTEWPITYFIQCRSSGAVTSAVNTQMRIPGWTSLAKPIPANGRCFMVGMYDVHDDRYEVALLDVTDGSAQRMARPAANPIRNLAWYVGNDNTAGSNYANPDTDVFAIPCFVRRNNAAASLDIVEFDFNDTRAYRTARHNGVSYMAAGCVYGYDGAQVFESSFIVPPAVRAEVNVGGGSLSAGVYSWFAIYEWIDAEGNVYWSEPSLVQTDTAALNDSATVRVLTTVATYKDRYSTTKRFRRVRIKLYRTVAGGGEYYLVSSTDNDIDALYGGTVHYATFSDTTSDTALIANAKPYRHPGLLGTAQARMAPPAALDICEYSNGLAVLAEDARTVWLTAQNVPGEAAWWNPIFQYDIAPELVAIREMDGQLFVWSKTAIYVSSGNLPVDNGRDGGLSQFRKLTSDVGCVEVRSILPTRFGIFFQSRRGIELLARSGEVVFVGQQVHETLSAYPVITSVVHDPVDDVALFACCLSTDDTTGVVLVFDMQTESWVSVDVHSSADGDTSVAVRSATMAYESDAGRPILHFLDGNNYVMKRTGSVSDATYSVPSTWETPWIKPGLQHEAIFWQAMLLFEREGAGSLQADIVYDWTADYETKNWSAIELATYTRQVEMRIKTQKQAFKVVFTSYPTASDSLGLTFIGLSVDMAIEQREDGSLPHIAVLARK